MDLELVLLADLERDLELIGFAESPAFALHETLTDATGLDTFAARADFPRHGLVLRPDGDGDPRVRKDLLTREALVEAFTAAQGVSTRGTVLAEHDLRAHRSPSRMEVIARAAADLVSRAAARCPSCVLPGFGRVAVVPGLPCRDCRTPTAVPVADALGCVACDHRARVPRVGQPPWADPARCDFCNP